MARGMKNQNSIPSEFNLNLNIKKVWKHLKEIIPPYITHNMQSESWCRTWENHHLCWWTENNGSKAVSNAESVPREIFLFILVCLCTFTFICKIAHQASLFLYSYSTDAFAHSLQVSVHEIMTFNFSKSIN